MILVGPSINDHINPDEYSLKYILMDNLLKKCQSFTKPCWLAKMDLASAFSQIIVHPDCWNLLGFKWLEKLYMFTCLSFGLRSAPFLFSLCASALLYITID